MHKTSLTIDAAAADHVVLQEEEEEIKHWS